jgi:hypothetical protein
MTTTSPFIAKPMTHSHRQRLNNLVESAASSVQPTLETLDDGCVRVCIGANCGVVSSHHLVEPKINQLKALAFKPHQ